MVGGRVILYEGIIGFNLGAFTFSITDFHPQVLMIYLIFYYFLNGAIDLFRALEAKRINSVIWKEKVGSGFVFLLITILCLININSVTMMVRIFSGGLIYSGVVSIVSSFKRSAIIYIQ